METGTVDRQFRYSKMRAHFEKQNRWRFVTA